MNKAPTFSANPLQARARHYATVIQLLYARQKLAGKLSKVNRGARHLSFGVRLSDPLQLESALKLAEPLALAAGVNAVLSTRLAGLANYQIELNAGFWEYYHRADLPTQQAVGLAEQRRPILFELDPPHALIAGTSGSGKSEALKSIILALLSGYTPLQLALVLIDPHNEYGEFDNSAYLVMPRAVESKDIANALAWVNQELAYRKAEDIKNGKIIVVAVGEASESLKGDNTLTAQNVARQARKYRIHLVCETQKPNEKELPGLLDNLLNRWVGQLADAGVSARITGHAGLSAHKLTGRGDFLHIAGPEVERLQIAQATASDFARLERCEIKPIVAIPSDPIELPGELPQRAPGRPALMARPEWLAYYAFNDPQAISRGMASELNLSRDFHEMHKDLASRFVGAYLKLIEQNQNLGYLVKALTGGQEGTQE